MNFNATVMFSLSADQPTVTEMFGRAYCMMASKFVDKL